jgi:hypothetical protein
MTFPCTTILPLALLALAGCQTVSSETSDGRPMPPPARRGEAPPSDAPLNALSILYGPKPADSDANGRPDRMVIEAYLFARPYPVPTWREGTFVISAYPPGTAGTAQRPGVKAFHTWRVATQDMDLGRFKSLIGEGYRFQISLLDDGGTDIVPGSVLDFTAHFEPAGSNQPVWSDGVRTLGFEPIREGDVR